VDIGSPAIWAISVSECSLPWVNVTRIEVILLVTVRPDSVEFPATRYLPKSRIWVILAAVVRQLEL
jgi:hypothetical protein